MSNFWQEFKAPILALAPMEDVTDTVFRRIIMSCGRPDVMFTEFTSCEGVQSVGQAKVIHRLKFHNSERPIVAQVWGITPEDYFKTAQLITQLGFDGMDINMGCPVKKVIQQGACSALIKNPSLAKEIIIAAREGLTGKIPLSIKTRIGFNKIETETWCGFLLRQCQPDALIVHGRTVKEQSKVPNHWEEIGKVAKLRDEIQAGNIENLRDYTKSKTRGLAISTEPENFKNGQKNNSKNRTLILGNGDINSLLQAKQKIDEYNLDGVMIGRAVFHNPWIFNGDVRQTEQGKLLRISNGEELEIGVAERIDLLKRHINLWQQTWGESKNYSALKKYFKIYLQGFLGASKLRAKLMETKTVEEGLELLGKS